MAGPAGVAEPTAGVVAAAWLATRCPVAIARARLGLVAEGAPPSMDARLHRALRRRPGARFRALVRSRSLRRGPWLRLCRPDRPGQLHDWAVGQRHILASDRGRLSRPVLLRRA